MADLFDSPSETPNAFEHQRFRLRTPDGTTVKRSFRELVTEADPNAAYALAYPQAFYNVAALNLLSFLAQWAFAPPDAAALAERVERPLTDAEFEAAVAPLRSRFALTGDGPRFMQAPSADHAGKVSKDVSEAVLITHRPNKERDNRFLFRSDQRWAVAPDQAALFLFARNTFYEGAGGGGGAYKKGANGDPAVRTMVTVAGASDTVLLRRTLWLNVLAVETPERERGDFPDPGEGYDEMFWANPPNEDVPVGSLSLKAGLGWMTAFHWLDFQTLDQPMYCVITGRELEVGKIAASRMAKSGPRIGYGEKGSKDSRADRLFLHPNLPLRRGSEGEGRYPFLVHRAKGLIDAVGASFFGSSKGDARFIPARVVQQLNEGALSNLSDRLAGEGHPLRLVAFGFHMLSDKRNVHGGAETDTVRFVSLVGATDAETVDLNVVASEQMYVAVQYADEAARLLRQAIRRASGVDVKWEADEKISGRLLISDKQENQRDKPKEWENAFRVPFASDTLAAFWRDVQDALEVFAHDIAEAARNGGKASAEALIAAETGLKAVWEGRVVGLVWKHFAPAYDRHLLSARTMPYAAAAHRMLGGALQKIRQTEPVDA
ncbi:MAG: type I-E CRISPR-associated protein Cse1/CasA [Bacteroidota bacterium]